MNCFDVSWNCLVRSTAVACLFVVSTSAVAGTAMEEKVIRSPMPHTQLASGGAIIPVHYVRLLGGPDSARLMGMLRPLVSTIKAAVDVCVKRNRSIGAPAKPPRVFPQLTSGTNTDMYFTANREIIYLRNYAFQVKEDCSLREEESYTATLTSLSGSCHIDLISRTAEGQCDPALHAAATVPQRPTGNVSLKQQIALLKSNPQMAAAAAQLEQAAASGHLNEVSNTRQTRRVLGIECEVLNTPTGASVCAGRGGSFRSFGDFILEISGQGEVVGKAVQAQLDAKVNAAVFAPHRAGGFRIISKGQ